MIKINLNELEISINENLTVEQVKNKFKPEADIVILNGFTALRDDILVSNDSLTLIKRGEKPTQAEMESLIIARHSPKVFEKLKTARVGIAGLGGLGSHIAMNLARTGVGFLKLVDHDVVEPSNLNRQCYNMDQIGMPKTEALKENILKAVNITKIETQNVLVTRDNASLIFEGLDAVAEAFDTAETKTMFAEVITKKLPNTFLVCASGIAGLYPTELFKVKKLGQRCIVIGDFINEARKGMGLMAPRVATAAGIQSNILIRFLLGEEL